MGLFDPGRSRKQAAESGELPLRDRLRDAVRAERRLGYWPVVAVLGLLGMVALFLPGLRPRTPAALLREPGQPRPGFRVLGYEEIPFGRIERLNVTLLVGPAATDDTLRQVLDWALYGCLEQFNRSGRRHVQVVWAYALDDSCATKGQWRAMAVWVDPRLPEKQRPSTARLGGDAVAEGSIQYDFTNPGRTGPGQGSKGER